MVIYIIIYLSAGFVELHIFEVSICAFCYYLSVGVDSLSGKVYNDSEMVL